MGEITFDRADDLSAVVHQAIGAGSVCWVTIEGERVFDDVRAREIADAAIKWIEQHYVSIKPLITMDANENEKHQPTHHRGEVQTYCPKCKAEAVSPINFTYSPETKNRWHCNKCGHYFNAEVHD